jgi:HD-GYP domain-containing protein (c-di-GMP phosphodiesterase class II)
MSRLARDEDGEQNDSPGLDMASIGGLSRTLDATAGYDHPHGERVAEIAGALGRRLGFPRADLRAIELGALLHDLGMTAIPEEILAKPERLDDEDWQIVRRHPLVAESIVAAFTLHPFVAQIVRSGHERIDGTGYPHGLVGDEIPLPARVVHVAEAFDALTSDRPYRPGRPEHQALAEIRANAGSQFCPTVVATLDRIAHDEPGILGTIPVWAVNVA